MELLPGENLPRFTSVTAVSNHALLQLVYSEHLAAITPHPIRFEGFPLLVKPTSRATSP